MPLRARSSIFEMVRAELAELEAAIAGTQARIAKLREIERLAADLDDVAEPALNGHAVVTPPAPEPRPPAPKKAAGPAKQGWRGVANEERALAALREHGELPQARLGELANIPTGTQTELLKRMQAKGMIAVRLEPNPKGGRARRMWRLADGEPAAAPGPEPAPAAAPKKPVGTKQQLRDKWSKKRAEREAAAVAAGEETLHARILDTLRACNGTGLTMAHLSAAVPGQERAGEIEDKVRQMWQDGELGRLRDGCFVIASTRSWNVADDREEMAADA